MANNESYKDNIIVLHDEEGNDVEYHYLEEVFYKNKTYIVLVPEDEIATPGGHVVIVEYITDGPEEGMIYSVEDDEVLTAVFDVFKEDYSDIFTFKEQLVLTFLHNNMRQVSIFYSESLYMNYYSSDYFSKLWNITLDYTAKNYDLSYLTAMHEKIRTEGANTIIVGSSHAMNGVIESLMPGGNKNNIGFSISSQDLYYDFCHIKKCVECSPRPIQNCIINIGYYMMYQDISKGTTMNYLIPSVYVPLFGRDAVHHYDSTLEYNPIENIQFDRSQFPEQIIVPFCQFWAKEALKEQSSFYGKLLTREDNNILGLKKISWNTLTNSEKENAAIARTNDHNRLFKHKESFIENCSIIQEIVTYLNANKIRPIFLIMPFTKYYNAYIKPSYKKDIFSVLDALPFPVDFFDMNDLDGIFTDEDFLDTDHLNLHGAEKATIILSGYLNQLS